MKSLEELIDRAKSLPGKKISLAGAHEQDSLIAAERARSHGIADFILVGDRTEIEASAKKIGIDPGNFEIQHEPVKKKISSTAISVIHDGRADVLMKGLVTTANFMRAILDKKTGLLSSGLLSHLAVFEIKNYPKLLGVTDAAINIAPTLGEKITMIESAASVFRNLGVDDPKVACVCAVEKVNPGKMPCTEEAAVLAKMSQNGQIQGATVDGPFGLDNAVSPAAAKLKNIGGDVAGNADIILCPDIEAANVLYKTLAYLADCDCGAIVIGTSAPVILTSRADSDETKFASIALAIAAS